MTATATLGPAQSTFVLDEKPKTRRTIVISVPRLFNKRIKTAAPTVETKPGRIRSAVRLTKEKILGVFAKLWSYKPVRYISYFVGAVAACVVTNLALTIGALLLAYPFILIGWSLVAELVFIFAYMIGWYVFLYNAIRWTLDTFNLEF